MLKKIRNYIEWGVYDLNELIDDQEMFDWFYNSPNFVF